MKSAHRQRFTIALALVLFLLTRICFSQAESPSASGASGPTITPIPDQTRGVAEQNNWVGSFGVGNNEAEAVSFRLAARSSNQELVPNGNIFLGGRGTRRTVFVQPANDRAGTAIITITVTAPDGRSAATSFRLTVVPESGVALVNPHGTPDGRFGFDLATILSGTTIIHASTNLSDWFPVLTNRPGTNVFRFVDPDASKQSQRFYRARMAR